MATFKEIRGQTIKKYTTNPTNPLEGQMWYNNTTGTLKGVVVSEAWSSASNYFSAQGYSAGFGTQTAGVQAGGSAPSPSSPACTNITGNFNGNGYFIDTTSNACNLTLPGGTLGDEVSVVDYAGTFDTNNLTVTPDSGERIQGEAADATLTVATERAGFTLAYSGASQGWLLKNN